MAVHGADQKQSLLSGVFWGPWPGSLASFLPASPVPIVRVPVPSPRSRSLSNLFFHQREAWEDSLVPAPWPASATAGTKAALYLPAPAAGRGRGGDRDGPIVEAATPAPAGPARL